MAVHLSTSLKVAKKKNGNKNGKFPDIMRSERDQNGSDVVDCCGHVTNVTATLVGDPRTKHPTANGANRNSRPALHLRSTDGHLNGN
jgi:hypothetical protein